MPKKICIFAVLCVLTISLPFYAFAAANGLDGENGITHSIITDREIEKNTAKAEVFYDKHFEKDCKPEKICFGGSDETDFFMEDVGDFPVPLSMEAVYSDTNNINNEGSIYCWTPYLLSEGSYPAIREFFEEFNITRMYQCVSEIYLEQEETAAMVKRLADDGIETVVLTGERSWGLAGSDLSSIKSYIDAVKAYNSGAGADAKIGKLALDVETYTYSDWKKDSAGYFADYIINMKEIYNYAHEAGLEVVQVIPVHFDTIDEGMFREFVETCCDEISIMNYTKSTQVNAVAGEIELCRELGMKIETIFETMPYSEYFDVTEENTYFYEGLDAMMQKRSLILQAYNYEKLSASYHHFPTMYHVATGNYMAEIYAYTNSEDPSRNSLGQTYELETLILYGDDGSMIQAGLYNPNLGAKYEENCYLAVGVKPGVTYTVTAGADNYTVTTPEKSFTYEDGDLIDCTSIRIKRIENETPEICSHVPELINVKEAGCLTEGYTGDTVCTVCGKILKTGQAAAATGHEPEYVSNIDGTHTIGCTKCEYMTADFDCADNNGDGYCDCCGCG